VDEVFKTVHRPKTLINKGLFKVSISSCAQKTKKFSTVYPQNVENLRKLKKWWIVWIKKQGIYVDNVNLRQKRRRQFDRKERIYLLNRRFFKGFT